MEVLNQVIGISIGIVIGVGCMKIVHFYVNGFHKNAGYAPEELRVFSKGSHFVRTLILLLGVYTFYFPLFEHEVWVWALVWGFYEYKNLCMKKLSYEVELEQLQSNPINYDESI